MNHSQYETFVATFTSRMTNYADLARLGKIESGRSNLWRGASGFEHQIDVSVQTDQHILLVECKYWRRCVPAQAFLVMWARVTDIAKGSVGHGRKVRGALVTTKDFQSGTYPLAEYYKETMSLFVVNSVDEFCVKLHTHFVTVPTIRSSVQLFPPAIVVEPSESH